MKKRQAQSKTFGPHWLIGLLAKSICALSLIAHMTKAASANDEDVAAEKTQRIDASPAAGGNGQGAAVETGARRDPLAERKKRKKKKQEPKERKQPENSKREGAQSAQEGTKKAAGPAKEQRFEILTVSDDVVAVEYSRAEPGLKIGDKMYVIHPEKKGFVAVLEIEQVEPRQKSLSAKILESDPEFSDNVSLSGLEVMSSKRFLVEYDSFRDGPLYPETPATFKLFSQYANRNPTLFFAAGMGFSQHKETQFVVEETTAPAATSVIYRGEVFLPEVFGQFWLNWFGGGYEMYSADTAALKVKDGSGNIVDEAYANGSGSSAWASIKPSFPYFVMSKIELRVELMRNRNTQVYSPEQFALSEKSLVRATIKDTAPRYFLGYQSRLASFGFFQVTGMLPLQPAVNFIEERANGSETSTQAKLKEINVEGRFIFHLTFMEPPHQLSFDLHIGGIYNQKAYSLERSGTVETIVTPYDLQPFVLIGLSYVK